jgi:hypothetical protein
MQAQTSRNFEETDLDVLLRENQVVRLLMIFLKSNQFDLPHQFSNNLQVKILHYILAIN